MYGQQFQFGAEPWPAGKGVLQVYAPVDLDRHPELRQLIHAARQALSGAPVRATQDQYMHVTIDVVAGVIAEQIPEHERAALAEAISKQLRDVPVFRGTAGPVVAGGAGAKAYISPASPLELVQQRVRTAIRTLRGEAAASWNHPRPHISTHYCVLADGETVDSDPWNRRLYKGVDSLLAPIEITHVVLVDVRADNTTREFSWTPASDPIPLAGTRVDSSA